MPQTATAHVSAMEGKGAYNRNASHQAAAGALALGIAGALLAAIVGALAVLDPSIATLIGSGPVSLLAGSLAPALAIIAWLWTNSHTTLP